MFFKVWTRAMASIILFTALAGGIVIARLN